MSELHVKIYFAERKAAMSGDILYPRETGEYISKHSKDVTITDEGVKTVAKLVSIWSDACFHLLVLLEILILVFVSFT